jgi:pilus assembly protein CpaB
MRTNTIVMIVIAIVFGAAAMIGTNMWLTGQRASLVSGANAKGETFIVVASKALRFGDQLSKDNLREVPWNANAIPAGAFTSRDKLLNSDKGARQVLTPIEVNEPVLNTKITGPGQRATLSAILTKGMKAVALRVNDVLGVAGFVTPGDRVDIMLTRNSDHGDFVDVLLQNIKILAIDQIADERKDDPRVVRTVTVEVNTEDAQKLTLAANVGTLSLALRQVAANKGEDTKRVTVSDLNPDSPEDVARRQAEARAKVEAEERAKAEADAAREAQLARFDAISDTVRQVADNLGERIDSVEGAVKNIKLEVPAPAAPEPKEIVREVMVTPPEPQRVTVTVTRGVKSQVYDVMAQ